MDSNENFVLMAKKFRKFFRKKNPKNIKKNVPPKRTIENFRKREMSRSGPQCYECKGYGQIAADYTNKQKKIKLGTKPWLPCGMKTLICLIMSH